MTDIAQLGIKIESDADTATIGLKALVGASKSAETHAAKLARSVDKSNQSLSGFGAIAQRSTQYALHLQQQIERLSAHEIRNVEIQEYGRELDRLRAKFNPLFAASKQYEASLDEINYAHRVGAISAMEQSAAIARLDEQYEAAARAANQLSVANKSMRGSFHTTNLLFQMQDIGMMTGLGQNPLAIMLQQGPQITGVFHQIGNGRQIVQALGAAFMGLINPVSLATLAVVGLGAAGVQALMSMASEWGPTKRTFEEHSEWLNKLLEGYDNLQKSVGDYLDQARKLPAALARLEIGQGLADDIAALNEMQRAFDGFRIRDDALIPLGSINEDLALLRQLKAEVDAGAISADDFANKMRLIELNPNVHGEARRVAGTLADMVLEISRFEARVGGATRAMEGLSDEALVAATRMANLRASFDAIEGMGEVGGLQNILDGQVEAMETLTDMVPEIRTQQEIAADLLGKALSSPSEELRSQAQAAYDLFMRNTAIMDARRESERLAKRDNPYEQATKALNDNIKALEQQALTFGLSETAASRFNTAMDFLRAAEEAKIPITAGLIDEINGLANAYSVAEEQARRLQEQQQLAISINSTLASGFSNMFMGILDGSKSAVQAIGDLLKSLGQLLINQAFMMLFGGGTAGGFGGVIAGLFGFANGGYTGNGATSQVAGVVHGGEYVFSARAVDQIGLGYLDQLHRAGRGYRDGGYVSEMPANLNITPPANQNQRNDNGPQFNLKIVNQSGQPIREESVSARRNESGGLDIEAVIVGTVQKGIADDKFKVLEQVYGLRRQGRR